MATTKVTFTLDDETVRLLSDAAQRLGKPKSQVVRDAIRDFHARRDRLSESERQRLLKGFDELFPRIPKRPPAAVKKELADIRRARRAAGRRSRSSSA